MNIRNKLAFILQFATRACDTLLEFPHDTRQPTEDLVAGDLVAHSVGLLRRADDVRQAVVAALAHRPPGLTDRGERPLAAERVRVILDEARLSQEIRQDGHNRGVVYQLQRLG